MRPLLLFLLFISTAVRAQDTLHPSYRNFSVELGGNGGVYSLNYENKLMLLKKSRFNWDAGISLVPVGKRMIIDFPVSVSWLYGSGKHKAEFGTGQLFALSAGGGKGGTVRGTFRVGYRFEKARWYFRAAYTPFYSYVQNFQYENWFGGSFGFYLRK